MPVSIVGVSSGVNFLQVFGPASQADQLSLVGRVGARWSSGFGALPGVYSMSYAPAYRLYFMPTNWSGASGYNATQLDWLYYNHPDWIEYGSDGNVMYEFGNTTYPVVDVSNPAVQQYMYQSMAAHAAGYQALSLDNVSTSNINNSAVYQTGHYSGTIAPCPAALRPACGGVFVAQYTSAGDPAWTAANLKYIRFLSAQAKAAGLSTVANLAYQGGPAWVDLANSVSGVVAENVPQHQGATAANDWYNGFMIDGLFEANLYNADNATQKCYGAISYLNGHDTDAITPEEESYAMAWTLLAAQSDQHFLFAGQISSRAVEPYPPSMGGYVSLTTSGTLSASSETITNIPSTAGYAPGESVTATGLPAGTLITAVPGSTSITVSQLPTIAGTNVSLTISGLPALPMGKPVAPPPAVNPYATPPTGECGWVNGANQGVCSRQYSNGWVYMNPVCQYDGTGCAVASQTVTIPAASSGSWYDPFCNVVPSGSHTMNAATALVIAQGAAGQCPWP
ncbi:hypothetical protein C7402_111109 [Paraburkholderia unamae]|uniref:Uncharacterized protein n=2 Tax=Paraburkholderia unamae TaxID=219649 RepID=A0ABX5KMI1_9BURK|nr:hypothetical protein C7402_111109 [Paraburkholderia unamae]